MSDAGGIDVDRPQTWPRDVAEVVAAHAEQLRDTTEYAGDLDLSYEDEAAFLTLLGARSLRMYHCTRLLAAEVQAVRRDGLRLLSRDLMTHKINLAVTVGALTAAEGEQLARAHVFATGEHRNRQEQVCLVLSARPLDEDPGGIEPLMRTWGGEALSMSDRGGGWRARLTELGQPAVVVVEVPVQPGVGHSVYPGVLKTFVGAVLKLKIGADVFFRQPIPGLAVMAVWTRKDAPYEALRALPH